MNRWVEVERGRVTTVTLNDPQRLNALTEEMGEAFEAVMHELRDDEEVRVVILTGRGRAFSAGGDLDFLRARSEDKPARNAERMYRFYRRFLSLREQPAPVIAAINGHAIGAGLCLAMACELRVASREAKLGATFVGLGLHPGMGASHFFPEVLGLQRANELLLTGRVISGDEVERFGLSTHVVDAERVLSRAQKLAEEIASRAPGAVRSSTRTLRLRQEDRLERALWREADGQGQSYASEELIEGLDAIEAKRKPNFG